MTLQTSKISIALCTYNGARFLSEQLHSIATQHRLPDELIVCDDGSMDETVSLVEAFASQVRFPVRLQVNPVRLGATKNFEQAIELCRGDVIVLCDQDDVWFSHKLQKIAEAFAHRPQPGAVFSDAILVDEKLLSLKRTLWQTSGFSAKAQAQFESGNQLEVLVRYTPILGLTLAFHSSYRNAILPFPTDQGHDIWGALIIASLAKIALIKEPLVQYRQHPHQLVGINLQRGLNQRLTYTRNIKGAAFLHVAQLYEEAYQRVEKLINEKADSRELALLRQKADHFYKRGLLHSNRWRRLPVIFRELSHLRYHHFSNGVLSAAKDLFLS
ncbi:MAG TPA: glycosyltransferase family 2 protein [Blastocatellia bacterium]|nr:glycosyltransferase family 2 protein [Blastocatellia bacterium]